MMLNQETFNGAHMKRNGILAGITPGAFVALFTLILMVWPWIIGLFTITFVVIMTIRGLIRIGNTFMMEVV